ncbi:MAG: ornithine carbamoyltransferase [Spirochaetota bacterium]|nr:MAG: ornithine carbamoyltransferase [Spirochaetota bacterium]
MKNKIKDLISIEYLNRDEITEIFDLAQSMKANKNKYYQALDKKVLAMVFEKPSLRTRFTFETGIFELGGHGIYLGPQEIQLGKRESIYDAAKNLERWAHGIVIRTFAHSNVTEFSETVIIPVINGLDDLVHPCQALTDLYTLREKIENLSALTLAWVGDGNNVAHSLMWICAKLGVNMNLGVPDGYEPNKEITLKVVKEASKNNAEIRIFHDPDEAVRNADAVYTDVWTSMGRETEAERRKKFFKPFQVNSRLMDKARPGAYFMHCLPAHRGDEVTDEVIDSIRSIVFEQAENRLHVAKAIIYLLMR